MKKYICGAAAMLLAATLLFGCGQSNVSSHPGGKITEPTAVMPTIIPEPTMTSESTHATNATTNPATRPSEGPDRESEMTTPFSSGAADSEDQSNHSEKNRTDIRP